MPVCSSETARFSNNLVLEACVDGSGSFIFFISNRSMPPHVCPTYTQTNNNSSWPILCKKNCSYLEWQLLCSKFHSCHTRKWMTSLVQEPQSITKLVLIRMPPWPSPCLSPWAGFSGCGALMLPLAWLYLPFWFHEQKGQERWNTKKQRASLDSCRKTGCLQHGFSVPVPGPKVIHHKIIHEFLLRMFSKTHIWPKFKDQGSWKKMCW